MSFIASNDRIQVTDTEGDLVFDTTKPMPHIIQWFNTTVSVNFPNIQCQYANNQQYFANSPTCAYQEQQYICRYQNVCNRVYRCRPVTTCGYVNGVYGCRTTQQCGYETQCGYENVCGWEWVTSYGGYAVNEAWYTYSALNWSSVVDLGAIDEGVDADFILVNAVATRSQQGSIIDIGPIPCGLPLNTGFSANNSSIIESVSNVADGSPWMTRVMSIFIQSGRLYAEFKHTNRSFRSASQWSSSWCDRNNAIPYPPGMPTSPPSSASAYSFNLEVVVGKFTI